MANHKKIIGILCTVLAVLVAAVLFLWIKFGQRATRYQCTNYAMDTYIQQTVYGKNTAAAAASAAKSINTLENEISWRIEESDVARLNAAAGADWISIQPETAKLLQISLQIAKESGGVFDPTILPVSSLWDFGGTSQHLPDKADIQKFVKFVNYGNLRVNTAQNTASLRDHGMGIDLGSIEKGAACDNAVAAYKAAGAECGIIAVGGSVGTFGSKADGSAWSIAVRDPTSPEDSAKSMGEINLTSGYVSTSGTYEKYLKQNGILYHHLLNAKTGYPENNGLVSATIVVNNGALSDALSTACFLLGREKSEPLLKKYNAGAIFIDSSNRVFVSDSLKNRFTITNGKFILQKG